jgi:hypothetical protein
MGRTLPQIICKIQNITVQGAKKALKFFTKRLGRFSALAQTNKILYSMFIGEAKYIVKLIGNARIKRHF